MPTAHRLPIVLRRDETPVDRTLRFEVPAGAEEAFRFVPGHFLTISLLDDDVQPPRKRAYSLSSSPTDTGILEITVRDMGDVGSRLYRLEPGVRLDVIPPRGKFTLEGGPDDVLLLAGGSGVTPFRSFVRYVGATTPTRRVTLVASAKVPAELVFDAEFRAQAAARSTFEYVPTVTRGSEGAAYGGRLGRIDEALVRARIVDPARTWVYACGSPPFVEGMLAYAAAAGVPPERRKREAW
jgi:ferredoxin-NADP reductase